jgi:hypothetical protein
MKAYVGVDVTLALVGGEWSASHTGPFTLRERVPSTHWNAGWVGPRAFWITFLGTGGGLL